MCRYGCFLFSHEVALQGGRASQNHMGHGLRSSSEQGGKQLDEDDIEQIGNTEYWLLLLR